MNTPFLMTKRILIAFFFAVFIPLIAFASPADKASTTMPDQIGPYWSQDFDDAVTRYLEARAGFTSRGGKTFWVFEILDSVPADFEGPTGKTEEATRYDLWIVFEEYVLHENETPPRLEQGSGQSGPMSIIVRTEGDRYSVLSHWQPRDGAYYADDIREHMTDQAAGAALGDGFDVSNNRVIGMRERIVQEVHAYFDIAAPNVSSSVPMQESTEVIPDLSQEDTPLWQRMWAWIQNLF